MKNINPPLFAFLFLVLVLASCSKDVDKSDPVISDFFVNSLAQDTVNIEAGQSFSVYAQIEDDTELNQMRFSFDLSATDYYYPSAFPEEVEVITLGSEVYDYLNTIYLPDTVPPSIWKVDLRALDENGNETQSVRVVEVSNSFLPKIELDSLAPSLSSSGSIFASPGDTLTIYGSLLDSDNLELFRLEMRTQQDSTLLWSFQEELNTQSVDFNSLSNLITLPSDTLGSFDLYFLAHDILGYTARKRFNLNIND